MSDVYETAARCKNCDGVPYYTQPGFFAGQKRKQFKIPKGTTADEFLKDVVCVYCGCAGFNAIT